MKDAARDGLDDLSVRARRGELDDAGERRLRLFLETSAEARITHRAGVDIDAESSVLPGDDAMTERVIRRVLVENFTKRRRGLSWGVGAAIVGFAAVAAASIAGVAARRGFFTSVESHPATTASAPAANATAAPAAPTAAPIAAPSASAPFAKGTTAIHESAVRDGVAHEGTPRNERPAQTNDDAADLFASASLARREGNASKAIVLYDALQSLHPNAPEARAADISLGMLHLQASAPASALRHFRRYQQRSPRGDLAPEALWGEANALLALDRTDDARRAFTNLLNRYPESAYAKAARAKLESSSQDP